MKPTSRQPPFVGRVAAALFVIGLVAAFAVYNRPQRIRLDFGIWSWNGEAVHALLAAAFLGLVAMFLIALPADLRASAEQRRLANRVRALERDLEAVHPPPALESEEP